MIGVRPAGPSPEPSRARRAPTRGQMARRAFLLRWAKRLLPLAGVGLLLTVALWPEFERDKARVQVSMRGLGARPEAVRVVAPRYQGLDERNRPYTVTADLALQAGEDRTVALERPRADILLAGGGWALLEAREGRYDRDRNRLDLAGAVTLWNDDGTMLVTDGAEVDLAEGAARGDRPVRAQGPFGTLSADGFRLRDRGAVVVFTGRARVVLEGGE